MAGTLGLLDVVQPHGSGAPCWVGGSCRRKRVDRLEAACRQPCPSERPLPVQQALMGDQQGDCRPETVHLLLGHAQEVGGGDFVLEDGLAIVGMIVPK